MMLVMLPYERHELRTTVTLDEDVVENVKRVSRERGVPFREALNDLIRLGYYTKDKPCPVPPLSGERLGPPLINVNFDK